MRKLAGMNPVKLAPQFDGKTLLLTESFCQMNPGRRIDPATGNSYHGVGDGGGPGPVAEAVPERLKRLQHAQKVMALRRQLLVAAATKSASACSTHSV